MENTSSMDKRKACDVCYAKKIKCNMAKPCSNCELYGTPCKTSLVRHRAASHKANTAAAKRKALTETSEQESREALEKRIAFLEERLERLDQGSHSNLGLTDDNGGWVDRSSHSVPSHASGSSVDSSPKASTRLSLPPLDDILPLIERFFTHVNPFIPLFDEESFPRILMAWNSHSGSRSQSSQNTDDSGVGSHKTKFVAINVVVGLACQVPISKSGLVPFPTEERMVRTCMQNIESQILQLASENEGILGLQVMLGLIYLYLSSRDAQPATMLIGTAVQLCCRLRLNNRQENLKYPARLKLQRERVFWITYILDRDISLRYQTAPMMSEDYSDVEIPDQLFTFKLNTDIENTSQTIQFDFFRSRIQLARVQGRIYDKMYSHDSQTQSLTEQDQRLNQLLLEVELETWRQSVPTVLQAEQLARLEVTYNNRIGIDDHDGVFGLITQLAEIHFAHLSCLVRIHGVYSHDAEWQRLLNSFQRHTVQECSIPGSKCSTQLPPLQQQWDKCVKASRDGLRLSQTVPLNGSNIWSIGCAYVSGLIVVLANMLFCDDLLQLEEDELLVQQGFVVFNKMRELSSLQALHQLHRIASGLRERGTQHVAVKRLLMEDFAGSGLLSALDIGVFGQV